MLAPEELCAMQVDLGECHRGWIRHGIQREGEREATHGRFVQAVPGVAS